MMCGGGRLGIRFRSLFCLVSEKRNEKKNDLDMLAYHGDYI